MLIGLTTGAIVAVIAVFLGPLSHRAQSPSTTTDAEGVSATEQVTPDSAGPAAQPPPVPPPLPTSPPPTSSPVPLPPNPPPPLPTPSPNPSPVPPPLPTSSPVPPPIPSPSVPTSVPAPPTSAPAALPPLPGAPGTAPVPGPPGPQASMPAAALSALLFIPGLPPYLPALLPFLPVPPPPAPHPPKPTLPGLSGPAGQVVALTNTERAKAGCGPLKVDRRLVLSAQRHSVDMATRDYFEHEDPDGHNVTDRERAAGFVGDADGENIAMGQRTAAQVMNDWMHSPGHRRNILDCSFTLIGVGYVAGGHYWTQNFGG